MPTNIPQYLANGNILPCRFVVIDTTAGADNNVVQAGANGLTVGVTGQGTNQAPLSDLISTQYHAQQGDPAFVHPEGDVCLLEIGAAVTQGQMLKSDSSGRGVPGATTGATLQQFGARALESSSNVGAKIRVQVIQYSEVCPA